jgi:hypothetical protein
MLTKPMPDMTCHWWWMVNRIRAPLRKAFAARATGRRVAMHRLAPFAVFFCAAMGTIRVNGD